MSADEYLSIFSRQMKAIVLDGRPVKRDMALIAGMAPGTCICKEEVVKKQGGGGIETRPVAPQIGMIATHYTTSELAAGK